MFIHKICLKKNEVVNETSKYGLHTRADEEVSQDRTQEHIWGIQGLLMVYHYLFDNYLDILLQSHATIKESCMEKIELD